MKSCGKNVRTSSSSSPLHAATCANKNKSLLTFSSRASPLTLRSSSPTPRVARAPLDYTESSPLAASRPAARSALSAARPPTSPHRTRVHSPETPAASAAAFLSTHVGSPSNIRLSPRASPVPRRATRCVRGTAFSSIHPPSSPPHPR